MGRSDITEMDTTASIPPQKVIIRQLSTNEIALGELRSPPQKLQQHGAQSLKITAEKGQEELFQFACIIQSLGPLCWGPKRNVPGGRYVPSLGKGRPPSPGFRGGAPSIPPHPRAGGAEVSRDARNKEESRGGRYRPCVGSCHSFWDALREGL